MKIDTWLDFSQTKLAQNFDDALKQLNSALASSEYLVGNKLTVADLVIFGSLKGSKTLSTQIKSHPNLEKYLSKFGNIQVKAAPAPASAKPEVFTDIYHLRLFLKVNSCYIG